MATLRRSYHAVEPQRISVTVLFLTFFEYRNNSDLIVFNIQIMCYARVLLFLTALAAIGVNSPIMAASESVAVQLARGVNIFSSKFFYEVAKSEQNKNLVTSPFSAEVIFALLSLGAQGGTHDEILRAMTIPDDEFIRVAFKEARVAISKIQGVQFNMANRVFVSDLGFELAPEFEKDSVDVFQAGVQKISFSKNAEAAGIINSFVEENTNNRIKDLIQPDDINSNTRVVLVNALHFKGTWKKQFNPAKTANRPFMVTPSKPVQIPMMSIKDDFRYGESSVLDAQLLELPYQGEEMSMLFVLPRKADGLQELQQKLADGADLYSEIAEMSTVKVDVLIPKFKIETKIDLKEVFKKLGATTVFDAQRADLEKVAKGADPLYVSQAVQKAFIEVNEEGAEAAAASAVRIQKRSIEFSQEFVCDRPALFLLCHGEYAIFVGVLMDPSTENQTERDEL